MKQQKESLSFDEALQNPSYEHLWDTLRFLDTANFADVFPEKHIQSLKEITYGKLKALYLETPSIPLKDVVTNVLETLPAETSAALIMEMTQFAIEKWGAMTEKAITAQAVV